MDLSQIINREFWNLEENVQKMDKEFVKTNLFDDNDRNRILEITGGDNYTYLMAKMYAWMYQIGKFDRGDGKSYTEEKKSFQWQKYNKKYFTEIYNQVKNYNKNVFPLENFNPFDGGTLHPIEIAEGLSGRQYAIDVISDIPSVYLRNLKSDIRKPRTFEEYKYSFKTLMERFYNKFKKFSDLSERKRNIIYNKTFSSKRQTFEEVIEHLENLTTYFVSGGENDINDLLDNIKFEQEQGEAELLYNDNNIIVVDVKSNDAMKNLGCGSNWCFNTEKGSARWAEYAENSHVNIVYNFNEEPDSATRMMVVLPYGSIYNAYNEYMDGESNMDGNEGWYYLDTLGVADYVNANVEAEEIEDGYDPKKFTLAEDKSVEGLAKKMNAGIIYDNQGEPYFVRELGGHDDYLGVFTYDRGRFKQIGGVNYHIKDGKVIPLGVSIDDKYQKRGIGTAFYKYIKDKLGMNLHPSHNQTKAGKNLWQRVNEIGDYMANMYSNDDLEHVNDPNDKTDGALSGPPPSVDSESRGFNELGDMSEEIDASEAHREQGALQTIIDGKRDVGLIMFGMYPELIPKVLNSDLNVIRVKQDSHPASVGLHIVYRDGAEKQANRLHDIMKSHGGYVADKTPEEAFEIGRLLGYTDDSIQKYVDRVYGKNEGLKDKLVTNQGMELPIGKLFTFGKMNEYEDYSNISNDNMRRVIKYIENIDKFLNKPNFGKNISLLYRLYGINVQNIDRILKLVNDPPSYYDNLMKLQDALRNFSGPKGIVKTEKNVRNQGPKQIDDDLEYTHVDDATQDKFTIGEDGTSLYTTAQGTRNPEDVAPWLEEEESIVPYEELDDIVKELDAECFAIISAFVKDKSNDYNSTATKLLYDKVLKPLNTKVIKLTGQWDANVLETAFFVLKPEDMDCNEFMGLMERTALTFKQESYLWSDNGDIILNYTDGTDDDIGDDLNVTNSYVGFKFEGVDEDLLEMGLVNEEEEKRLHEESISRLWSHIQDKDKGNFAIMSASRNELSGKENQNQTKALSNDLQKEKAGHINLTGHWEELHRDTGREVPVKEMSFFIPKPEALSFDVFKQMILDLGNKYDQESVIIGKNGIAYEVYSNGGTKRLGKLNLQNIGKAYSAMRKKPDVTFVFEGFDKKNEIIDESRRIFDREDYQRITDEEIINNRKLLMDFQLQRARKEYFSEEDIDDVIHLYLSINYNYFRYEKLWGRESVSLARELLTDLLKKRGIINEERIKSWMPKMIKPRIKKSCTLGGNSDGTSDACSQGDTGAVSYEKLQDGQSHKLNEPNVAEEDEKWFEKGLTENEINEALPLDIARKYSSKNKNHYSEVFGNRNRMYFDFDGNQIDIDKKKREVTSNLSAGPNKIKDELNNILRKYDFEFEDFKFAKNKKTGQKIKLGKALNYINKKADVREKGYLKDLHKDLTKMKSAKGDENYESNEGKVIVISRHPYDIAGMSTDREWRSCMNLIDGEYCNTVEDDVKEGTLVAYVINQNDTNINKPIARKLIKPYHNVIDGDDKLLFPTNRTYGTFVNGFDDVIMKIVDRFNGKLYPENKGVIYKMNSNLYGDSEERKINKKSVSKYSPEQYKVMGGELKDYFNTLLNTNKFLDVRQFNLSNNTIALARVKLKKPIKNKSGKERHYGYEFINKKGEEVSVDNLSLDEIDLLSSEAIATYFNKKLNTDKFFRVSGFGYSGTDALALAEYWDDSKFYINKEGKIANVTSPSDTLKKLDNDGLFSLLVYYNTLYKKNLFSEIRNVTGNENLLLGKLYSGAYWLIDKKTGKTSINGLENEDLEGNFFLKTAFINNKVGKPIYDFVGENITPTMTYARLADNGPSILIDMNGNETMGDVKFEDIKDKISQTAGAAYYNTKLGRKDIRLIIGHYAPFYVMFLNDDTKYLIDKEGKKITYSEYGINLLLDNITDNYGVVGHLNNKLKRNDIIEVNRTHDYPVVLIAKTKDGKQLKIDSYDEIVDDKGEPIENTSESVNLNEVGEGNIEPYNLTVSNVSKYGMMFEFTSDKGLEYVITIHFYVMPKKYYLTDDNILDNDKVFINKEMPDNMVNLYVTYTTKEEHEKLDKKAARGDLFGKKGGAEDNFPTVNTGEPLKILSTVSLALKSAYKKAIEYFGIVNIISYLPKRDKTGDERRERINQIFVEKGLQKNNIPIKKTLRSAGTIIYFINSKEPNVTQQSNETYINESMTNENNIPTLQGLPFKDKIESMGGEIYSVGGAVRDDFLGKPSKDLDIVVKGIPEDELLETLKKFGNANLDGESFGVIKFKDKEMAERGEEPIDIALPRKEISTGAGHKNFEVVVDHELDIEDDLKRRDFTINAIAQDADGAIIDPFNGRQDLKDKVLRMTSKNSFIDDELRMLRGVQFASRFGFEIEPKTLRAIRKASPTIKEVAKERWLMELEKIVQKGDPWLGLEWLKKTNLYEPMFGKDEGHKRSDFQNINTMGEYIFMIIKDSQPNPQEFFLKNLMGGGKAKDGKETLAKKAKIGKEIQALNLAYKNVDQQRPARNRFVASHMINLWPEIVNSQVLPEPIEKAIEEIKSGKYPKNVNELAANGGDFMNVGIPQGREIGNAQRKALFAVYSDIIPNEKDAILKLVQSQVNVPDQEPLQENESVKSKIQYGCLMVYPEIPNWQNIVSKIKSEDVYDVADFGIENEPHATILYGFHDKVNAEDFLPFLSGISEPIEIVINGISHFENEEFDVVKLDCESQKLREIRKYVEQLPHTKTYPHYVPHMTLAYVKKGEGKKYGHKLQKPINIKGTKLVYSTPNKIKTEMEVAQPIEPEKELL